MPPGTSGQGGKLNRPGGPARATLLLLATLLAGCGSTVATSQQTSAGGGNLSVADPAGDRPGAEAPRVGSPGEPGVSAATGSLPLGTVGSGPEAGLPTSTPGASTTAAHGQPGKGHNGPGVTATTISIGVAYFQNASAANAAIGGKGIDVGDPMVLARTAAADINRRGGIAGRQVKLLFFAVDPQSATPYANEAQQECAYFTDDHAVFAVIDGTQAVGALARGCLEQHGVVFVTDNSAIVSDLARHELDPDSILWSRVFASLVPSLARQHWFSPWNRTSGQPGIGRAKIGIVTADRPALNRAVDQVLIPLLRAAGYTPDPADVYRIAPPGGFSDDGATVAAIQNAALRLNTDGVDHVILTDSNGSISLLFNNYAYTQHYFPRYGGTSGNFWQSLLDAGDLRPQTLVGAVGLGWAPEIDLPFRTGDGPLPNATRHHCFAVMRAHGQAATSATVAASQLIMCDAFGMLRAALQGIRDGLNADVAARGADRLGGSFQPGLALADHFRPGQHDGVSAAYDMAFSSSCGCLRYTGQARALAGPL